MTCECGSSRQKTLFINDAISRVSTMPSLTFPLSILIDFTNPYFFKGYFRGEFIKIKSNIHLNYDKEIFTLDGI